MSYQVMMCINREELDQIYLTIDSNIVWQAQKLSTGELKGKHTLATKSQIHPLLSSTHRSSHLAPRKETFLELVLESHFV